MRIAIPALLGAALFSFSLGAAPTEPPPASPAAAGAEPDPPPAEPHGSADLLWAALQLVPSPETVIWNNQVRFGARWQVTPLLYSFGRSRRVSPWRSFLVEPIARHSGSIEAHFSPEILAGSIPGAIDRWIFRAGLRGYLPLLHRGDYLSGSFGSALLATHGEVGAALDAGLHTLGGFFGLRVGHGITPGLRITTVALEIRIF